MILGIKDKILNIWDNFEDLRLLSISEIWLYLKKQKIFLSKTSTYKYVNELVLIEKMIMEKEKGNNNKIVMKFRPIDNFTIY